MIVVSIVIPAYNVNEYLGEACNSVLAQTLSSWECIIVDDGSTDSTASVAEQFCIRDHRFRLIRQDNAGVSVARNIGMSQSRGVFVAFLDADDLLEANALELWVNALETAPGCILAWGGLVRFEDGTGSVKPIPWKNYLTTGCAWYDMLVHDFMPVGSFCLRRAMLTDACLFKPDLTHVEDRDFLLRVLQGNTAVAVNHPVLRVRLRATSASSDCQAAIDNELRVMLEHLTDSSLPGHIRRRANSALAFRCAVIAAFTGRQYRPALAWYLKAIVRDPLNINVFLLPLRKCMMAVRHSLRF